jgi:hypothetical protein
MKDENEYKVSVEKLVRQGPFENSKHKEDDNIKVNLTDNRCEGV